MTRACAALVAAACAVAVAAEPPGQVVVVLDGSARMSRIGPGDAAMIDTVGDALGDAVAAAAAGRPGLVVGLRVAGGGDSPDTDGPCAATTLALPLTEPDDTTWGEAVAAIEPAGSCPLIAATVAAVDDLESEPLPVRIVVVTAGPDDCGGELTEVGEALAGCDSPVDVRLVGLALEPDVLERFGQVAIRNATGLETLGPALAWALEGERDAPPDEPEPPAASVAGPDRVVVGRAIETAWSGPGGPEDFVSVARPEAAGIDYLDWSRIDGGSPSTLTAPREPGAYELRYVDGETGEILARSAIEVAAIPVALEVPASAAAGRRFTVHWRGPADSGDIVAISPAGSPANRVLDWATTAVGSPLTLAAPPRPGTYEVRYLTASATEIVAAATIEVVP
jgi:Ca-activated chloride channel family protein